MNGTWTRGVHFVEDRSVWEVGEPDLGDPSDVRGRFGLRMSRADSFAVERRRGWTETADMPPRPVEDAWDEHRGDRVEIQKARPGSDGSVRLTVRGTYAVARELCGMRTDVRYELHGLGRRVLDDVQWADWDGRGGCSSRPMTAGSRSEGPTERRWEEVDEAALTPDPPPSPDAGAGGAGSSARR
jgi:hypothetical protein